MDFQLPIFHLAQLVGAAAGLTYDELQFKRHLVRPYPVTDRMYAS
jgi:heterodisulfide reductase subunit B